MSDERSRIFVKPAPRKDGPGVLVVRDPDHANQQLPAEGAEVTISGYWLRRLRDGDVIDIDQAAQAPEVAPAPDTKRKAKSAQVEE